MKQLAESSGKYLRIISKKVKLLKLLTWGNKMAWHYITHEYTTYSINKIKSHIYTSMVLGMSQNFRVVFHVVSTQGWKMLSTEN